MCKVTNIVKTTVFVETEDGVKGSIVMSEVAPGRIRNLRAYVVPKKIIVCKILSIKDNHLFLSLRRVKKEQTKNLLQQHKKEKSFESVLKKIIGEKAKEIVNKIKDKQTISEFLDNARENQKIIEKYFPKKYLEQIKKVIAEKKQKEKQIKKEFKLSCNESDGIIRIKKILKQHQDVSYLGSSKFVIKIKSADLKKASHDLNQILEDIEKQAKKSKCDFEISRK